MAGTARIHAREQRGSAALEFALIAPVVLLILFGIMNWGLWLNDAMNLRQGVREASREGVVNQFGSTTACGATYGVGATPSTHLQELVCSAKDAGAGLTGETYVKVLLPGGWVRGQPLVVCTMIKATRISSMIPLPSGGVIRSESRMAIETVTPGQTETAGYENPPAGTDWSWCTA